MKLVTYKFVNILGELCQNESNSPQYIEFLSDSLIIYIFVYLFVSLLVYFIPALF